MPELLKKPGESSQQEAQIRNLINIIDKGPRPDDRWNAVDALAKIGKPAIPALMSALTSSLTSLHVGAAEAIKRIQGSSYISGALTSLMKDASPHTRAAAALALGQQGEPLVKRFGLPRSGFSDAVPALTAALKDKDDGVRMCAAEALGKLQARSALPDLQKVAAQDKSDMVRDVADEASKKMQEGLPKTFPPGLRIRKA